MKDKHPYNIAVLISTVEPGGAEQQAIMLARELERHFKSTLLVVVGAPQPVELPLTNINLIRLDLHVRVGNLLLALKAATKLRRVLRQNDVDILLSFGTPLSLFSLLALVGLNIRVVVCERIVPWLHHPSLLYRLGRRWLYSSAAAIVCQTETVASWYRERFKEIPCFTIKNLSRTLISEEKANLKFERNIVCVARMRKQKAHERLIKAFKLIADRFPGWGVTFVGGGELINEMVMLTRELDLTNRVNFVGDVPDAIPFVRDADLFVLPSLYEGYPNALNEAMQLGKPCIAYRDAVQHTNMIDHGVNGWLCESDPDNLSDYLALSMGSDILRREIGERANKVSETITTNTQVVHLWISVIKAAYADRSRHFGKQ